jgi:hypothetical protein
MVPAEIPGSLISFKRFCAWNYSVLQSEKQSRVQTENICRTINRPRICHVAWLAFSLYCCLPVYAIDPKVAAGLKVGIPYEFIDIDSIYAADSYGAKTFHKYDIKPSISASFEISLPWNLALEMSSTYKEMKYHRTVETISVGSLPFRPITRTTYDSDTQAHAWEFPLTIRQYMMPHRRTNVFVEGGFAARRSYRTGNYSVSTSTNSSPPTTSYPFFPKETKYIRRGVVAGAGMDIPLAPFHILPEIRYTWWLTPETFDLESGNGRSSHSLEILLGFSFGGKTRNKK